MVLAKAKGSIPRTGLTLKWSCLG